MAFNWQSYQFFSSVLLCVIIFIVDARCPPKRTGTYSSVEEAVRECPELETLHLKVANLTSIDRSTFQGFKYLSHLYISEANITNIEEDSFQTLPYLTTLSITRSGLENINFGDLGSVEILDLYENPGLNVSGIAKDLQILNLNDCDLNDLPYELIKHSKDIILSARYNKIAHIPLDSIAKTKLSDLSFNQITKLSDTSSVNALVKLTGNPVECHCPEIKIFLNGQYRGRVYCAGPPEFANLLVNRAIEKCHRLKRDVVLSRSTRGDIDSLMEEDDEQLEGSGVSTTPEEGSGGGILPTMLSENNFPVIDDNDSDEETSKQPVNEPIIVQVTGHQDSATPEGDDEDEEDRDYENLLREIERSSSETTSTTTTTEDPFYKKYHKTDIDKVDLISEIPDLSQSTDEVNNSDSNDFNIPLYKDLVNVTNDDDDDEITSPPTILVTSTTTNELLNRIQEEPRSLDRGDIPGINEPGVGVNDGITDTPRETSVGMIILFATLSIIGIILLAMACRRNRGSASQPIQPLEAPNAKEMKSLLEQPEKPPKNTNDYVIIPLKDDEDDGGHRKENGNGTVLIHNTPPSNGGPIENGHLAPPISNEHKQPNGSPRVSDSDDEVVRVLVTERFYPESLPRTPERIHKPRLSPRL